ncbi:DUF3822 family protein [uncultured Draconibacterium sp.]|uniref:DUF3822 family protein n=1 Tax=uncultured Draconibacterium sp. TaxID=1573823 RepID=UPI003261ABBA
MHEFVDEIFQPENSTENILSIQVSLNGFSFSVICPTQKKLLYFKTNEQKISSEALLYRHFESWFTAESLLQQSYKNVFIIYHAEKSMLVPDQLKPGKAIHKLEALFFDANPKSIWVNNSINQFDAHLYFSVPEEFSKVVDKLLPAAQFIHPVKWISERVFTADNREKMFLLFETNQFTLLLFEKTQLKLVNNFSFKHPNDVIFYVFSSIKQFGINKAELDMHFAGNLYRNSGLEQLLYKHFPGASKIAPKTLVPPSITEEQVLKNISLFL